MRSVSSATCTSGEPVSPSCCANFLMVSAFREAAKLICLSLYPTKFLMRKNALGTLGCQPVVEHTEVHEPTVPRLGERGEEAAGGEEAERARPGGREWLAAADRAHAAGVERQGGQG